MTVLKTRLFLNKITVYLKPDRTINDLRNRLSGAENFVLSIKLNSIIQAGLLFRLERNNK